MAEMDFQGMKCEKKSRVFPVLPCETFHLLVELNFWLSNDWPLSWG